MDAAGDADRQRVAINRDEKNELDFKGEPINTLPNLENKADAAYKKLMTVSNPHASSIEYDAAYDADLQARRAFDDANSTEGQYARRDFDRKSAEETFTKYGPQVTGSRTFNRQSRAMAYANRARELETLAGALHEHSVAPEFQAAHPDVEFTPQGLLRKQEEAWRLEEHAGKAADEAARSAISVEVPDVNEEVTLLASDDQKKRWGKALADFRQAEAAINSMIPELKQLRITQLEDQAQAIKGMLDAVMNGKTNEAISDVGTEPAPDVQEGGDLNVHPQPVESEGNGVDEDPSSFEA
jgi:hypothetical protein